MIYPWKRFWRPRKGRIDFSDGGFLYDPESKYAKYVQQDVIPFEKIVDKPCLVLLGEPGIGKSKVIEELRNAMEISLSSSNDQLLYINLNEYGNESRLIQDLFNSKEFMEWKTGKHVLHLLLDSLDECKIQIPQVATLLKNRFSQIIDLLKRLKFRIACRTSEWSLTLEQSLPQLWGNDSFGAYELCPLRRKDINVAAQMEDIDANKFMAEIERTESVALAFKPVTLKFLMSVFRSEGRFPHTRFELYEKGCMLLCEELNPNRKDLRGVGGTGTLSAQERLFIASRIAVISIFCRKPTVCIGSASDSEHVERVILSELAGSDEVYISQNKIILENNIRETLGTGLYSSRGAGLMGFAHQTYAEFLAARYIHSHNIPTKKILSLLRHSGDFEAHIVPQLYETTAWIAGMNNEVFSAIAFSEPQVLLRCDEGALSSEQRAELTQSFLEAMDECRINDRDWDLHRYYAKLKHSGLKEQLYIWLTDGSRRFMARNTAIDIAEACKVTDLQSTLADLALNEGEGEYIRSNSTHAVATIGDPDTRARLKPLIFEQAGKDPEDQLKGNALRALWPNIITTDELFANLTLPKRQNFFGAYIHFVEYEIAKHLNNKSLPCALQWLEEHAHQLRLGFPFSKLADDIMVAAWRYMDDPNVLQALASATIKILENHHQLITEPEKQKEHEDLFNNVTKRRELAKAIIEKGINPQNVYLLAGNWNSFRIIDDRDFEWCLEGLMSSISQLTESTWAILVWTLFMWAETSGRMLDVIVDARAKSTKLEEESASFFTPVILESEQAKKLQSQYEQSQEWQKKKEPKLLEWLPKDRIQHYLNLYKNRNKNAWWLLLRQITLEDTSEKYEHLFDPDIKKLPGWTNSDNNIRNRILDASENYLRSKCSFNQERLLDGSADEQDIAGYKAILLLMNERLDNLINLPEDVWAYWTPIFFGPFGYDENREIQKLLISIAYDKTPESVLDRLKQIIRHQICKEDRYLSVLELVENIWDHRIAGALRGMLEEAQVKPLCWGRMLAVLLTHADEDARLLAENKLSLPLPKAENDRAIALQATLVMIQSRDDAAWPVIWPILQSEGEFGSELMTELAYELHHDPKEFVSKLTEDEIADLYIWLVRQFPYHEDPQYDGVHSPTKEDAARELRTRLINFLEKVGTPASCQAVQRIAETLPELDWLKIIFIEARKNTLQSTWRPLQIQEFLEITSKRESVLVRNASELQEVLVDGLGELQSLLQGKYAATDLWDQQAKGSFRPKDENYLSDWVGRNLEPELTRRGVIIAREVEIRRGEKTDIHVTAIIPGLTEGSYEQVCVIIETKGCWNRKIKTAMKSQLIDRYLKDNECNHGIYLVGWYACDKWDSDDYRKADTPSFSLQQARQFFYSRANELSTSGITIKAVVLNAALR